MQNAKIFEQYSDQELIQKILGGEVALFEILIRRNNPYLYKTGRSYDYNHEDTQDLMQDTFIDAFHNLSKFENRSTFKTWLIKIMLNNCYKKKEKFSFKNERIIAAVVCLTRTSFSKNSIKLNRKASRKLVTIT